MGQRVIRQATLRWAISKFPDRSRQAWRGLTIHLPILLGPSVWAEMSSRLGLSLWSRSRDRGPKTQQQGPAIGPWPLDRSCQAPRQ